MRISALLIRRFVDQFLVELPDIWSRIEFEILVLWIRRLSWNSDNFIDKFGAGYKQSDVIWFKIREAEG